MARRFLVTWEVEVDAFDPKDAVQKAAAALRRPGMLQGQVGWTAADLKDDRVFTVDLFMDKVKEIRG